MTWRPSAQEAAQRTGAQPARRGGGLRGGDGRAVLGGAAPRGRAGEGTAGVWVRYGWGTATRRRRVRGGARRKNLAAFASDGGSHLVGVTDGG